MLKPGDMGKPDDAGPRPAAFADSLASEMEDILNHLLDQDHIPTLPDDNSRESRDRRRLFVAIARAIIKHLDQNRASIHVPHPGGAVTSPTFDIDGKDWL